jgi:D-sedoheptulose 7-phosphate isomerase
MNYSNKYLKSFSEGMELASYTFQGRTETSEVFLNALNVKTEKVKNQNGRIFFFGNGASASFANHMALDWSKNGGVSSISLSDSALLTALSNDYSYEDCFKEFLKINFVTAHDLIVTISSSGNSKNIISALEFAKEQGISSFALSGLNSVNKSIGLSSFSLFLPFKTYGMVECGHQLFLHLWLDSFMKIFEWDRLDSQNMNSKAFKL